MSRLRSNCEKQRCGLHLPNNPVQSLTGRFFKCWCKIAAKQHWTGKLWVGGSTAVIKPQPHNYESRFSLTWFRTLTVSKLFQISAHHKRIFLNRYKFPSCKPDEKLYFSLTTDVQRSFREAWTETLSFVLLGLRTKKNPAPHLALHYVSCLHKSILYSSPFHVVLSWFFRQMFLKTCTTDKAMVLCTLRNISVAKEIVCFKWCLLTAADSSLICRFLLKSMNWSIKQLFQQLESGSKHMKASNVAWHQHRQMW